ncbi:MAG: ABC transporter substrate-binding protein [bacterium]|nr:ABC transporter substrate-binding protein [bacterium]
MKYVQNPSRRLRSVIALVAVLALVAAACGEDDPAPTPTTEAMMEEETTTTTEAMMEEETTTTTEAMMEEDEHEHEDEDEHAHEDEDEHAHEDEHEDEHEDVELVVAIGQDITVRDQRLPGNSAAAFSANRHITESLTFFNANGSELMPVLATSWEQVEPTRWRFHLREGVHFHNGNDFNADTAVYSFEKSLDPDFSTWYGFVINPVIAGVEKVDDYTIDVITNAATPLLPNMLAVVDMVDPAYDVGEQQNIAPVGTGPYMFNEFVPLSQYVMDRNEDYWGGHEAYSRITWRIIPEQATRVQALLSGEVSAINAISTENIAQIEGAGGFTIAGSPTTRLIMIALRNDRAPLDNPLVRQAMNYAVDKATIVEALLPGIAVPANGILTSNIPGANAASDPLGPWPYDPDQARALLAEAGYNGEPITIAIGAGRYPSDDLVGQAVVAQLVEAGLNIQLEAIDYSTMQAELSNRETAAYDGWLQGWGSFYLSPTYELEAFFGGPDGALPLFYDNPDYQTAIEAAINAESLDQMVDPARTAERIAWEDAGGIFLYFPVENLATVDSMEGFSARFDEFFYFSGTHLH